jgi:eukaryotic-like serine/threonine-protein kinase
MALDPGTQLGGYEIRRQLGAGGMGVVYLAHDVKLGRSVAMKVLSGDFGADHTRTRRFEQEARAASALSHPNVCVVHALGETSDGQPFIAMEYVDGQTLRQVLQSLPPSLRAAFDIAIQIASGVGAAHSLGIVHRDLKPENVIVRADGLVKVLDFGLAKLASGGLPSDVPEMTRTVVQTDAGLVMGTFTYMAPEQARGVDVDARADIWALGVILYELVSGSAPFTGETRSDVLAAILDRDPVPLDRLDPRVPHELQRIVAKALRKDRAQRYQTVSDLRIDLEALRNELQSASSEPALPAATPAMSRPVATTPAPARRESSAEYILTGFARHKVATVLVLLAAGFAALMAIRWLPRRSDDNTAAAAPISVQRNLTRLTVDTGLQTDPTFSPDGRFIAYASDRAGNFDIWVQPVSGGDPVQVTKSPDQDTEPDWSPDGSSIVFRSEREGGGLYTVPALGGAERKLTAFGMHPKWSHDGSQVFFLVGPILELGEGLARAYTVDARGGVPRELASSFLAKGTWRWIAPRPDGRISAIGEHSTLGPGFYTFTSSGTEILKSAIPPELAPVGDVGTVNRFRFQWNASGTALFVEVVVTGVESLWRVEVDPVTLAWRSAQRLTTDADDNIAAAPSPDGGRLAFSRQRTSSRLWAFPLDASGGRLAGEGHPFSDPGGNAQVLNVSKDGDSLAYVIARQGIDHNDIALIHLASGKSESLVTDGSSPVLAPDGKSLVFARGRVERNALFALFFKRVNSTEERQISPWSDSTVLIPQSWGTDGTTVLVALALGQSNSVPLWAWPLAGGSKPSRVLMDVPGVDIWQASYSPDGRWLVFLSQSVADPSRSTVTVAPAGAAPKDRWVAITSGFQWADKPRWSQDGRQLYFLVREENGFYNLRYVRFDGATGHPVGAVTPITGFNSPSLMISPDLPKSEVGIAAHRVVLTMLTSVGSIWMLDNVDK